MTPEQQARELLRADAEAFANDAMINHWQVRVRAEQTNKTPFGQITTVKDCYEYGFLAGHAAGVQAERERIWAEIQSKLEMCADSWRIGELDLERIIFGEQP